MLAGNYRALLLVVVAVILMTGCASYKVGPYRPSSNGIEWLEKLDVAVIAVGEFVSNTGNFALCSHSSGLAFIRPPEGATFSSYFQEALISELRQADVYSDDGQVLLSGKILDVELNSITSGFPRRTRRDEWNISMIITSSNGRSISITNTTRVPFGIGWKRCKIARNIFPWAVKNTMFQLIVHKDFKQLVK